MMDSIVGMLDIITKRIAYLGVELICSKLASQLLKRPNPLCFEESLRRSPHMNSPRMASACSGQFNGDE